MKKIEFGFSNDSNPTGSWEGIGLREGVLLTEADYYGSISYANNNYIIAKVGEDEYHRFPELVGNFIVRQALCDLYADGSVILMLNQENDPVSRQIAEFLNSPQVKDRITKVEDIIRLGNDISRSPNSFILAELNDEVIATSIDPVVFAQKNEAIKNCRNSISDMQMANHPTR